MDKATAIKMADKKIADYTLILNKATDSLRVLEEERSKGIESVIRLQGAIQGVKEFKKILETEGE